MCSLVFLLIHLRWQWNTSDLNSMSTRSFFFVVWEMDCKKISKKHILIPYLLAFIKNILPVPEIFPNMPWNQVMFRNERKEAPSAVRISRIPSSYVYVFHTLSHLYVFTAAIFWGTQRFIRNSHLENKTKNAQQKSWPWFNCVPRRNVSKLPC